MSVRVCLQQHMQSMWYKSTDNKDGLPLRKYQNTRKVGKYFVQYTHKRALYLKAHPSREKKVKTGEGHLFVLIFFTFRIYFTH